MYSHLLESFVSIINFKRLTFSFFFFFMFFNLSERVRESKKEVCFGEYYFYSTFTANEKRLAEKIKSTLSRPRSIFVYQLVVKRVIRRLDYYFSLGVFFFFLMVRNEGSGNTPVRCVCVLSF